MKSLIRFFLSPLRLSFVMGAEKTVPNASATAVTQGTSRATGVTINNCRGTITTHTASLAAAASASFTVTNTEVAIGDVPVAAIRSGATNKETSVRVTAVAAGSFEITVFNQHSATAEVGAIVINYAVIKSVLK